MVVEPSPLTVHCPNCDAILAEVAAPAKLRIGGLVVCGAAGRGIWVECACGHSLRWFGRPAVDPQDVDYVVPGKDSGATGIDNLKPDVQDNS